MPYYASSCYEKNNTQIHIGDKVFVSDPLYFDFNRYNITIDNMYPGLYDVYYEMADNTISKLQIQHYHFRQDDVHFTKMKNVSIGVDSARCGFFDTPLFDGRNLAYKDIIDWKEVIFDQDSPIFTINKQAVVSTSGWGDGEYDLYQAIDEKSGKVIGLMLDYFVEDDLD